MPRFLSDKYHWNVPKDQESWIDRDRLKRLLGRNSPGKSRDSKHFHIGFGAVSPSKGSLTKCQYNVKNKDLTPCTNDCAPNYTTAPNGKINQTPFLLFS